MSLLFYSGLEDIARTKVAPVLTFILSAAVFTAMEQLGRLDEGMSYWLCRLRYLCSSGKTTPVA